jgi:hypothetical protein
VERGRRARQLLPADWVLIGGLMVQLHAWEHGVTDVRATIDVDVLGQARPQRALHAIDAALVSAGYEPVPPDIDGYAHRYVRDGLIVDVLAPDGIKPPATLDGSLKAVGYPAARKRSHARKRSPFAWATTCSSFVARRCSAPC